MIVIDDPTPRLGPLNMAVDELLLHHAHSPTLRFYRWSDLSVSFGYFGSFAKARDFADGRAIVRRWTGGGIVPHGKDVTYSLIVPALESTSRLPPREAYGRVHASIAEALRRIGISAVLAQAAAAKSSDACFANPVTADVMEGARKIAGAAQRRTRVGLLHQGSVQRQGITKSFPQEFSRCLSQNRVDQRIDSTLMRHATELARQKYATDAWLRRR